MSRQTFSAKMRMRREHAQFERALRSASPSMQQEMLAAAARQGNFIR